MPAVTLPDALVRTVIQTCDGLPTERDKTLASFCRLAKRYKKDAERVIYSRVTLFGDLRIWAEGSLVITLALTPRLAKLVQHLTLDIDETCEELDALLRQLPSVTEIVVYQMCEDYFTGQNAVRRLFEHHNRKLTSIGMYEFDKHVVGYIYYNPTAYPRLKHLTLANVPEEGPVPLPKLTSLNLLGVASYDIFAEFATPLARKLTSLSLSIADASWTADYDLSAFRRLERLEVKCWSVRPKDCASAAEEVQNLLQTIAKLKRLSMLCIVGSIAILPYTVVHRAEQEDVPSPSEARASFKTVLDALPSQVEHLSLTGSLFDAEDVAAFVLSARHPAALRTLRLTDELGERFRALLHGHIAEEWNLAQRLEQLGVELTTVVDE
ncbi:hypothetical protein JCM10450v2_006297 [Rhodotorula kratochvilovae]